MPTIVKVSHPFQKEVKKLTRKYPSVAAEIRKLTVQLRSGERPGNKVPGIGYNVFKVRLPNPSARRGKSGGFRIMYFLRLTDTVYLLTIYSKTEKDAISAAIIRQLIAEILQQDSET